ncbi:hypothetical protein [Candidatus Endomicrobiellum trichonymphae]|nr:hypothetical protein [Candidatus Endomicrobium trichonymphae]
MKKDDVLPFGSRSVNFSSNVSRSLSLDNEKNLIFYFTDGKQYN